MVLPLKKYNKHWKIMAKIKTAVLTKIWDKNTPMLRLSLYFRPQLEFRLFYLFAAAAKAGQKFPCEKISMNIWEVDHVLGAKASKYSIKSKCSLLFHLLRSWTRGLVLKVKKKNFIQFKTLNKNSSGRRTKWNDEIFSLWATKRE